MEIIGDKKFVGNNDVNLLADFAKSDELGMFESESLIHLIMFKWDFYAKKAHLVGVYFHFL